jgi:CheY-like chemotaxis protein
MIASATTSPLAPETKRRRLPALPEARRARPPTYGILIVEDEPCVRDVCKIAMQQQGFAVWVAANGQETVDLYRRHRATIDVVLMDVRMSGLDGPQTLARLQELELQVCCCFMTGGFARYSDWQLSNLSSCVVLRKPFPLTDNGEMLWELARKANSRRATADVPGNFLNPAGAGDARSLVHPGFAGRVAGAEALRSPG